MVGAIQTDIEIFAGRTYVLPVQCSTEDPDTHELAVRDLTGYTGAMQIRATADATTVLADAVVVIDTVTGVVTATVEAAETASATWRSGVYDLIIMDADDEPIDTLVTGAARLRRSVTR